MELKHDSVRTAAGSGALRKRNLFVASAFVAGMLMGVPANAQAPPQSGRLAFAKICDNGGNKLVAGSTVVFEIGKRPFGSFNVLEADEMAVKADVTFPQMLQISKGRVAVLRMQVNGFGLSCPHTGGFMRRLEFFRERAVHDQEQGSAPSFRNVKIDGVRDYSAQLNRHFKNFGAFVMYLAAQDAESVLARQSYSGPFRYGVESAIFNQTANPVRFRIAGQDANEIRIEVSAPDLGTRTVSIGKRFDLDVYYTGEAPGLVTMPYRITDITVGNENQLHLKVGIDRAR